MYFVGIDVAKRKHSLAAINEGGEKLITHFEFSNSVAGFETMLDKLMSVGITFENARVCYESTGHYGRALHAHLVAYGFEVCLANALQTARFRKAQSIRKVKNDAVDSIALAQWLLLENHYW
jgi:transposase